MLDPSWYKGREQTYIKHFVLRRYLQKLAYKWGWYGGTLNYVDCFAGPWQHASEELLDTSPFIAIKELRDAHDTLLERGQPALKLRCLFIEKDRDAFDLLVRKLRAITEVDIKTINGEFEENIDSIREFASVGTRPFTFFFIDPTGWTGYPLETIAPLLRHQPGEVLINFMTQFVGRFVDGDRPEDIESFNRLFGSHQYRSRWQGLSGLDREDMIIRAYGERVREIGSFKYVAPTVVLDPLSDRTHFHLLYATRRIEGLLAFRNDAERPAQKAQQQTRWQAQRRRRSETTGQIEMFAKPVAPTYSDELRLRYQQQANKRLLEVLNQRRRVLFDDLEAEALFFPWMSTPDLNIWLREKKQKGTLSWEGLAPNDRIPKRGRNHWIVSPEA